MRVVTREFDSFAGQCNFGLEQIRTPWVLSLDADYVVSQDLCREIAALDPGASTSGYRCGFRYCINGRPLRGTLYPPRTVLYRREKARYEDDGHGHRVRIDGAVAAYQKAVDFYRRYLKEEPNATDKAKVEKATAVLEAEIKRLQELVQQGSAAGSGSAAPPTTASQEVQQLGDVKVRGLVVIVTEPQGATIYLDDKKKGAFATTPWSGSIEGEHKLIIEKQGYKPVETIITADPSKLIR